MVSANRDGAVIGLAFRRESGNDEPIATVHWRSVLGGGLGPQNLSEELFSFAAQDPRLDRLAVQIPRMKRLRGRCPN